MATDAAFYAIYVRNVSLSYTGTVPEIKKGSYMDCSSYGTVTLSYELWSKSGSSWAKSWGIGSLVFNAGQFLYKDGAVTGTGTETVKRQGTTEVTQTVNVQLRASSTATVSYSRTSETESGSRTLSVFACVTDGVMANSSQGLRIYGTSGSYGYMECDLTPWVNYPEPIAYTLHMAEGLKCFVNQKFSWSEAGIGITISYDDGTTADIAPSELVIENEKGEEYWLNDGDPIPDTFIGRAETRFYGEVSVIHRDGIVYKDLNDINSGAENYLDGPSIWTAESAEAYGFAPTGYRGNAYVIDEGDCGIRVTYTDGENYDYISYPLSDSAVTYTSDVNSNTAGTYSISVTITDPKTTIVKTAAQNVAIVGETDSDITSIYASGTLPNIDKGTKVTKNLLKSYLTIYGKYDSAKFPNVSDKQIAWEDVSFTEFTVTGNSEQTVSLKWNGLSTSCKFKVHHVSKAVWDVSSEKTYYHAGETFALVNPTLTLTYANPASTAVISKGSLTSSMADGSSVTASGSFTLSYSTLGDTFSKSVSYSYGNFDESTSSLTGVEITASGSFTYYKNHTITSGEQAGDKEKFGAVATYADSAGATKKVDVTSSLSVTYDSSSDSYVASVLGTSKSFAVTRISLTGVTLSNQRASYYVGETWHNDSYTASDGKTYPSYFGENVIVTAKWSDGSSKDYAFGDSSVFISSQGVADGGKVPSSSFSYAIGFKDPYTGESKSVSVNCSVSKPPFSIVSGIKVSDSDGNDPVITLDEGTSYTLSSFKNLVLTLYYEPRYGIGADTSYSAYDCLNAVSGKVSNADVRVTFVFSKNENYTAVGTIHSKYLSKISALWSGKTEYYKGETFSLGSSLSVTATYVVSGLGTSTEEPVSSGYTTTPADGSVLTSTTALSVSYNGKSVTASTLSVREVRVTSLSLDASALAKDTFFYAYDTLDYAGLKVTATYENGTSAVLSYDNANLKYAPASGSVVNSGKDGLMSVSVYYKNPDSTDSATSTFTIHMKNDSVKSVVLDTSNAKTTFKGGETFSYKGVKATIGYNASGHASDTVSDISASGDFTCDTPASYVFSESDVKAGTKKVTITHTSGVQSVYSVAVVAPSVKSVSFAGAPTSFIRNETEFSTSGLVMTLLYETGVEKSFSGDSLTIDTSALKIDESTKTISSPSGNYAIKVSVTDGYGVSRSGSYNVAVRPNLSVTRIEFRADLSAKGELEVVSGTALTGKGIWIRLYYQDIDDSTGLAYYDEELSNASDLVTNPALGSILYSVENGKEISVSYSNGSSNINPTSYSINVVPTYKSADVDSMTLAIVDQESVTHDGDTILPYEYNGVKDRYVHALYPVNLVEYDEGTGKNVLSSAADKDAECWGYVTYGRNDSLGNVLESAKVVLFYDYEPVTSGASNVEVLYPHYDSEEENLINNVHIGKIFGNANANNRLFLSGSPSKKNRDWYSEETGTTGDFSYFPDDNWKDYGQTDNDIVGYDIVSTDQMVVLKSASKVEPTNYFRNNGLRVATDYGGNTASSVSGNTLYEESYPLLAGNIGIGAVSPSGVTNFNGDTLFTGADHTVCGLDIVGQVGNSMRITSSRSKYIDTDLKEVSEEEWKEATLFTDGEYLYLTLPDRIYVAYRTMFSSETKQYEWWRFDISGVTRMFEWDGKVYFGNGEGSVFVLGNGKYTDCKKIFIGTGGAIFVQVNDDTNVIYNSELNDRIDENASYTFEVKPASLTGDSIADRSQYIYYKEGVIGEDWKISGNTLVSKDVKLRNAVMGATEIYVNGVEKEVSVGVDNGVCVISSEGFDTSTLATFKGYPLCLRLEGEYKVVNIDKEACSFQLEGKDGEVLDLVGNSTGSYRSELHRHSNVVAYYVTAPFFASSMAYRKTIWAWSVSDDMGTGGRIEIGLATSDKSFDYARNVIDGRIGKGQYAYGLYDFKDMDMKKYVLPEKMTYYRPVSLSMCSFVFRNGEAENSVLSAFNILYTIPIQSHGRL